MAPFNIEAAKAGKPIQTRDGRKVSFVGLVCHAVDYPVVVYVYNSRAVACYTPDGKLFHHDRTEEASDLVMSPEKIKGWVNVYGSSVVGILFPSKYLAELGATSGRIACIELPEFEVGQGLEGK